VKSLLKSTLSIHTATIAIALAGLAAPAAVHAQAAPADGAAECADDNANGVCDSGEGEAIVVTGSRIRQPNLESANPISVVTGAEVFETGNLSVGDLLNDLPQLRNTYSLQNGTRFLGTRGLNLLDLRGLGNEKTLVLVNGRRHVGADILGSGTSPDVNTIPADLIERIDILTGGASAVYGSDAVAGVVNFILKDNFDGIKLRGQAGISKYGDLGNQFGALTLGRNFGDGRGNVAVALEYSHSSPGYASGRPNLRNQQAFIITDTDPGGTPNGSDGVFDRTFYTDVRSATISLGGMVAISQGANAPCGTNVSSFTCTFQFQPDGSLVPQTGTRIGIGPNGNFDGGNGARGREGKLIVLAPDLKRYSANLLAHFEISPALVPFVEAKYVRTIAEGSQSGPFFSQGTTLGDPGGRERIRLDNPFLSAQARALLTAEFLATTVNPNGGTKTAAVTTAINNGSFRFNLRRNWLDLGIRDEKITRETFRIVGGLRGDFNDDWNYEISVNYGQHKEENIIKGNVNVQRYLLAADTTRDLGGNIVCRSQLNPAGAISYVTGSPLSAGDDPRLAGDISACIPLNPFGEGAVTSAMRNYLLVDSMATGKITHFDVLGFVSGDTSGFFNMPGGPVKFSVGGEYRRETNLYDLDDLTQQGYAFYNAIPAFTAPALKVLEGFAEIEVPVLNDTPFFEELSLHGSGRVTKYSGAASSTGTVYTYGGEARSARRTCRNFSALWDRTLRLASSIPARRATSAPGLPPAARTAPQRAHRLDTISSTRSRLRP
jgi:outer membrane receptor protein involved in Fe transport